MDTYTDLANGWPLVRSLNIQRKVEKTGIMHQKGQFPTITFFNRSIPPAQFNRILNRLSGPKFIQILNKQGNFPAVFVGLSAPGMLGQ